MNFIRYRNINIRYNDLGDKRKPALLFFHGYLESLEIWEDFVPLLTEDYHVITMDLPGHGESGILSPVHMMDELAESAAYLLNHLNIKKAHIIGHSMGGYAALAFTEIYHEYALSCVLFHSTCFADTPEKMNNRNREIELIQQGKKETIINTNIPRAFANDNLALFTSHIERAKLIALKNPDEGIIALLNGMKSRPDRTFLLGDDKVPFLLITGRKDNYIPYTVADKIAGLGKNLTMVTLENSGHMGFIEEKDESLKHLTGFFRSVEKNYPF